MVRSVSRSKDFRRIQSLPRRSLEMDRELLLKLNAYLKTENGTMTLLPHQAVALKEIYELNGIFCPIPVGEGKTIISLLAPTIAEAKRPLLLIPAQLKKKTEIAITELREHYRVNPIRIMSYELLSRTRGQEELNSYCPDMIIADECHMLKNRKAACTRRVARHMKNHQDTKFVALSGTMTSVDMMDWWHICLWCLRENAPVPLSWREAMDWNLALVDKVPFGKSRNQPGALLLLNEPVKPMKGQEREAARKEFGKRLADTPGVVSVNKSNSITSSLFIKHVLYKQPKEIEEHFKTLRETWCTPNGKELIDSKDVSRYANEIASGFYYRWKVPAPDDWLEARKNWAQFVRKILNNNRRGIDSELQVRHAVLREEYITDTYDEWAKVKDKFEPVTECIWLDDSMLKHCKTWLGRNKTGLVWVKHLEFGKELSRITGVPFFAEGGMCGDTYIEHYEGPAIVSIDSNYQGKNLQHNWNKNLIVNCPSSNDRIEQLIGRTHRQGQESDSVTVEIVMSCYEQWKSYMRCKELAKYVRDTEQKSPKVLYGDLEELDPTQVQSLIESKSWAWKK